MSPFQVDRYQIMEEVGRGGMGVVFRAMQPSVGRIVALKILPKESIGDLPPGGAVCNEALLAAQLRHRNIVQVFDAGECPSGVYIAMEFLDGLSLEQRMQRGDRFSWQESVDLIIQLADALHHAHKKGILHLDIKPHNILTDREGRPVLSDFGIAALASEANRGTLMGTPAYMSPEQMLGYGPDQRSDIYSLGVVLYRLLTGRLPVDGSRTTQGTRHTGGSDLALPTSLNPALPSGIDKIVLKVLAKDPVRRYQSMSVLREDLWRLRRHPAGTSALSSALNRFVRRFNPGTPLSPSPAKQSPPVRKSGTTVFGSKRFASRKRRRVLVLLLAMAVLVFASLLLIVLLSAPVRPLLGGGGGPLPPMTDPTLPVFSQANSNTYPTSPLTQTESGAALVCAANLKRISVALEMYATDHHGYYPARLEELIPTYLDKMPSCPAAGFDTYSSSYTLSSSQTGFSMCCSGLYHEVDGLGANHPRYDSASGLEYYGP